MSLTGTRNVTVTLEKAREWYNSENATLKEVALQAFNKDELEPSFKNIKSFKDACEALGLSYIAVNNLATSIAKVSKASAAMFRLNIIRRALNLSQDLHLIKEPKDFYIHYPYIPFVTETSTYYKDELNFGTMEVIGKIKSEGTVYNVLGGHSYFGGATGLGFFNSNNGVGTANANFGFLGCASKEIAQHFGKYFGMLITEAKYGDIVDFEIVSG